MPKSRPPIHIRLVRPGEHAELRDVRLSALGYSAHLAEHLANESAAPSGFWRVRAKRATGPDMATNVAVEGSRFTGIIDGFLSEDGLLVEIGGMWVSPSLRRSGIGRDLLSAVCDWAREHGASRAGLWVRATNAPACLLYERAGFELAKTSDKSGETGLRLERLL